MKKLFMAILMAIMLLPSLCMAQDPVIKSDSRSFDPFRGIYDLRGHVYVQFPAHDNILTITGDTTQVHLYNMEVHGQGNIELTFDKLVFKCDKVDVYHSDRTAYVTGNCSFDDTVTDITADKGSYCWKTKLAAFSGNVKVNGVAQEGDVEYNVITQKFTKQ